MYVCIYLSFALWYILESMCIYPALALEPALTCFNGKWCLESNIWVVGVFIAIWYHAPRYSQWTELRAYIITDNYLYVYLYTYLVYGKL